MEEVAKPRNLGGSLPVPNVQDLAGRPEDLVLTPTLLHRYLRPQPNTVDLLLDAPSDEQEQDHVPVVDLGRLLGQDGGGRDEEAARLRSACENWGFFQVVNHGVPEETMEEMKRNVMGFFALPLAEKVSFAQEPGGIEGYGQAFVVSDEQRLDWADMFFLLTQPPSYRDLHLWPSNPSTFKDCLESYSVAVQRVAGDLLRAMAENLGVRDHADMTRLAASQAVRMNYYPPCPEAHVDRVLGLSPHSDAIGITLLLQVSAVPGLQIRRNGGWVPVMPLPGHSSPTSATSSRSSPTASTRASSTGRSSTRARNGCPSRPSTAACSVPRTSRWRRLSETTRSGTGALPSRSTSSSSYPASSTEKTSWTQ